MCLKGLDAQIGVRSVQFLSLLVRLDSDQSSAPGLLLTRLA